MKKAIIKAIATVVCFLVTLFSSAAGLPPFSLGSFSAVPAAEAAIISLESVVALFAGCGGAGLVVFLVASTTGLAGAAALTKALFLMGGPFGLLGGVIATAGLGILLSYTSEYGVDYVVQKFVEKWERDGKSKYEILESIDDMGCLVSDSTKYSAKAYVKKYMR